MTAGIALKNLESANSSSSLKKLRIINCNFSTDALTSILNTTLSLEEFEMSSTITEVDIPRDNAPDSMEKWLACLTSAQHTLKKLVLEDNNVTFRPQAHVQLAPPLLFGEYICLKHLEIYYDYILGDGYQDHFLPNIFPPNLEVLKFLRRGWHSYPVNNWERLVKILGDRKYLLKLQKIVLKSGSSGPLKLASDLKAACKVRRVELLTDDIHLKPYFADNFYGEGGHFP